MRQAAIDRDNISPEDAGRLARIQKIAKGWIKQNPVLHGLSMHAYLTGQKSFPGKLNKEGIGEHFDATNPKLDYSKEEHRQKAADAVVHDIMHSLAGTTTGKPSTAYGWYDRTVRKAMAKVGQIAPKILTDPDHALAYKLGLAITSQGQDVFPNAESAWHIYQHWLKNGEMPTDRKVFGGGTKAEAMEANLTKVNDLWKKHGPEGLQKILMSRMTSRDLKANYGLDSGEKADHVVNGAMGLGPKIGAFFSNLNGDFSPTTIDLWFSRNMNLMAGNMFGFSDKATRQDRTEKGEVVKSHLSELKDLLDSGKLTSVPPKQAAKMARELGALQKVPEGKLDRPTAKALAPGIYDWARDQHRTYQKSYGASQRSYHPDFKTPENVAAKKLDEGVTGLSDDPRTASERDQWRDIMARSDSQLKGAKVHLTNADKQALLWFDIKDLFKMGGSQQKAKADYLDAAHRLVRKVRSGELPGMPEGAPGAIHMQTGGIVPGDPDAPPDSVPAMLTPGEFVVPKEQVAFGYQPEEGVNVPPTNVQRAQPVPGQTYRPQQPLPAAPAFQPPPAWPQPTAQPTPQQPAAAPDTPYGGLTPPPAPGTPYGGLTPGDVVPDTPYGGLTPVKTPGRVTPPAQAPGTPYGGLTPAQNLGPLYRAQAYGPSLGETSYDQTHGPLGKLQAGDLAVSKNMLDSHPLGSYVNVVDDNGNVLLSNQRVADYSYKGPKKPNTNTFEVWNGKDYGKAHLVPVEAPATD
jgi:hypothetical protein